MPFFSDQKSQSSLTNIHFICQVVQEANFQKKKKNDISTVPPVRKLVLKSQQWHILYIVLSPLKLYWVLQGDQKQKRKQKSSCTKDNANKAKVCTHCFRTTHPNQAVLTPGRRALPKREHNQNQMNSSAWLAVWRKKKKKKKMNTKRKKGCFPWERGFPSRKEPRNHLTPRPVGPKNAPGAKWDGAQTDKTQGYGKVMCKNLSHLSLFHQ